MEKKINYISFLKPADVSKLNSYWFKRFSNDYLGGATATGHNIVEPAMLYCAGASQRAVHQCAAAVWGKGGSTVVGGEPG
jgi:hypothetical protein